MCVCYLCKLLNICDIQTGITDSLCKNQSGMLIDAVLYLLPVVVLDISGCDAEGLKIMEQIYCATIEAGA